MSKQVHAEPTKEFFVQTIVRDIALEDCILDLLDNCLDGARRELKKQPGALSSKPLEKFDVRIACGPERLEIVDNCGGIPTADAIDYAFMRLYFHFHARERHAVPIRRPV